MEQKTALQKNISNLSTISKEEKQLIGIELAACHAAQRTYGKQAEDLEYLFNIFLSDLKGFEPEEIASALRKWRLNNTDFPTVADIRKSLTAFETEAQRRKRIMRGGNA